MESLELLRGFPDLAPRFHHLRVDPLQPNRVWLTSRPGALAGREGLAGHAGLAGPHCPLLRLLVSSALLGSVCGALLTSTAASSSWQPGHL